MLTLAKIDETLIYYDGPQLFTVFDDAGQKHLCVLAEETRPIRRETWLCAAITDDMLAQVKAGTIDLRDGFAGPCVAIKVAADGAVTEVKLKTVPDAWLPMVGARL